MVDKILPLLGFEPGFSGVESNHSTTNWATTTAQPFKNFVIEYNPKSLTHNLSTENFEF